MNLRVDQEIKDLNIKLEKMQDEREDLTMAIEKLKMEFKLNKEDAKDFNSFNNEKFKYLFNKLFNGGSAELKLSGSEDPLSSGLEIYESSWKRNAISFITFRWRTSFNFNIIDICSFFM